jgi:ketopantoate hydroxymethyltransferase
MRRAIFALGLLAACDPAEIADKAVRRAAESVVMPVVNLDMPAGPAQAATACILDAASPAEQQSLARDVGVEAGSLTVQTIRSIASRPAARSCFAAAGVPPLRT